MPTRAQAEAEIRSTPRILRPALVAGTRAAINAAIAAKDYATAKALDAAARAGARTDFNEIICAGNLDGASYPYNDAVTGAAGLYRAPLYTITGTQPTLLFASDWTNATRGSIADADIRDTTKAIPWSSGTSRAGNFSRIYAVSAAGLGFPAGMSNVLCVDHYSNTFATVEAVRLWPDPAVGGFNAHRLYYRCDIPNSYGNLPLNSYHPIEPMSGHPPLQFEFQIGVNANGTWTLRIALGFTANTTIGQAPELYVKYDLVLSKFKTYRLEWKQQRILATDTGGDHDYNYTLDVLVFDESVSATVPAYTAADFIRISGPTPPALASLAHDNPLPFTMSSTVPVELSTTTRAQTVGTNGAAQWDESPYLVGMTTRDAFTYIGGVAVSQQDWCGPYVPGEHT
jgi:hypothetical protein